MATFKRKVKGFLLNDGKNADSVSLPTNRRYHSLALVGSKDTSSSDSTRIPFTKTDWATVKDIKATLDHPTATQPPVDFATGEDLSNWNKAHDYPTDTDGILPIYFADPRTETPAEQVLTSWGTLDVADFTFEVGGFDDTGLVNPKVELVNIYDYSNEPLGLFKTIHRKICSRNGGGKHTFDDTFFNIAADGNILNSVLWTTSKISNADIEINGDVREDVNDEVQQFFTKALNIGGVTPTFGVNNKFYFRDFAGLSPLSGYPMDVKDYSIDIESSSSFNAVAYYTVLRGDAKSAMVKVRNIATLRGA